MHLEAIKALAAEGRNQRRVDIENPVAVPGDHLLPQNGEEAREHHQLRPASLQLGQKGLVKGFGGGVSLPADHRRGHPLRGRPLQRIGVRPRGDDLDDPAVQDRSRLLCVQQGLQVGAAAGHQNGNMYHDKIRLSPFSRPARPRRRQSEPRPASWPFRRGRSGGAPPRPPAPAPRPAPGRCPC